MSTFDIDVEKAKKQSERLLPEYGVEVHQNTDGGPETSLEEPNAVIPLPDIELLPVDARTYAYDVARRMNHAPQRKATAPGNGHAY